MLKPRRFALSEGGLCEDRTNHGGVCGICYSAPSVYRVFFISTAAKHTRKRDSR